MRNILEIVAKGTCKVSTIPSIPSLTILHWELSMANLMRGSVLSLCLAHLRFSRSMTTTPSL
jgi:hypothetical protein